MTIQAPIILLPSNGEDFSTDTRIQTLSGTVSPNASSVKVNGSVAGVSYTAGDSEWSWTGSLENGLNTFQVSAVESAVNPSNSTVVGTLTALNDTIKPPYPTIMIEGIWSGVIVTEGSNDGGVTWSLLWQTAINDDLVPPTTNSITTNGSYRILNSGIAQIRVRASLWNSGTATIRTTGLEGVSSTINITYVEDSSFITVFAPSGISIRRYQDKIQVITTQNFEVNVQGYNFYVSYQSGGVNNQYVKINSKLVPVQPPSFYSDDVTQINQTVDTVGDIRITTTTDQVTRKYYYSVFFDKATYTSMVQKVLLPDVGFNQEVPFYFVVTAVVYDNVLGQVTESTYSIELEGSPLVISTGIKDLPARTQNDIILTYNGELLASDPGIDVKPGTVIRDTMDPISEETARIYVIQDFLARALSVSALQDFDDANGDGISDPPDSSVKKKSLQLALYLTSANDVQNLIDEQFDKLASNVNIIRSLAQPAVGSVIFYTQTPPIRDMQVREGTIVSSLGNVDQGIPSQSYRVLETKAIPYASRDAFFNSATNQYELEVQVEATNPGSSGNTDSYTIKVINSGADAGFLVENPSPIEFGVDIESNHDLASRLQLAFFADTGTEGGYAKTAVAVPGVHGVRVEKAGDSLMFRDYDPIRNEHIGGKVDIYVQGSKIRQVSDSIAFSFSSGSGDLLGEQFNVINALAYQFKTENVRVTVHTPIFEVNRVYNVTRSALYDLTGLTIIGDGDTIVINGSLVVNSTIGLASSDIILVDYKYRSSDTFILDHQPVERIVSVTGQLSGPLTTDNWELVKLQDPLEDGGSTIATDGIRIKFANNLPLTEFQSITDEVHIMVQGVDESLAFIGVDPQSVIVTNVAKTVTYVRNADYTLTPGTQSSETTLKLIDTGMIQSGQTVLISYVAIENFIVEYTTNGLLESVQTKVDKMKHACADVIVKEAVKNVVDFHIVVTPKAGISNTEQVSSKIQTAISNYMSQVGVGVSVTQSDIVHIIKNVADVDYVVVPFLKMVKSDGSFIVRDNLGSPTFSVYNQGAATSYITTIPVLSYKTIDKGGPENLFRGIFENKLPLILQEDPLDVSGGPGRAYIQADGTIIVSTRDGNLPDSKNYQAAYYVYGETGAEDIQVASLEYLSGSFVIQYDNPRQIGRQTL